MDPITPTDFYAAGSTSNIVVSSTSSADVFEAVAIADKLFPRSQCPRVLRCGPQVQTHLSAVLSKADGGFPIMFSLPVFTDTSLPYPEYVIEYADGTELWVPGNGLEPVRRPTVR